MTDEQKETLDAMKQNHWYYFHTGKFIAFFDELERLGLVDKKTVTGKKSNGEITTLFGYRKCTNTTQIERNHAL